MGFQDFTSLPPEQEQTFVVYEQTSFEASKKAWTFAYAAGAVLGVFALILYFSFDKPKNAHAVDEAETSELKEEKAAPKPAPAPAPAAAPEEAAPTEEAPAEGGEAAPAEGTEAAAEGEEAAAAPTPPPGATKAPPTALVGQ